MLGTKSSVLTKTENFTFSNPIAKLRRLLSVKANFMLSIKTPISVEFK